MKFNLEGLKIKPILSKIIVTILKLIRAIFKIFLNVLTKPKLTFLLIILIIGGSILFAQFRLKEKIFKKAAPKEKAMVPGVNKVEIPQEPILVKVYKTQKRDFDDNLPLLGTVKGFKEIDLKFETTGVIESFNFK
ncbi:MAG: hypothetical protein NC828_04850, partial [Candidatus Omnitrophica bacterium]|nr:hypothetical protein [Candidatus Omnitrophota bacterium]